jgi:hypothetical protein
MITFNATEYTTLVATEGPQYGNDVVCWLAIQGPDPGRTLTLRFTQFDTEAGADFMYAFNNVRANEGEDFLGMWAGTDLQDLDVISTTGRCATVHSAFAHWHRDCQWQVLPLHPSLLAPSCLVSVGLFSSTNLVCLCVCVGLVRLQALSMTPLPV